MKSKKIALTYSDYIRGISDLKIEEQLNLLEMISSRLKSNAGKKKKHSIMELEGLGENIWKDIDPKEYIRKERESWD
ncbi:MAG: hypothetical protein V1872_11305 [bacterium]